ncbi:MAG: HIT family protein, partial [Flavobacteriales bacterium]|nr:HIT family protein [Flavobacteriales bacterium]
MSIFSQIIAGEIPCYKIAETESCFAFLDISPLAKGHVLVVPKKEVDYYFDIDEDLFNELNIFS